MKTCTKCIAEFDYGSRRDGRVNWCLSCSRGYDRNRKNLTYVRKTEGTSQERSGVRHDFFDSWSDESAYALGLLFTDGCIQKRGNSWAVSFYLYAPSDGPCHPRKRAVWQSYVELRNEHGGLIMDKVAA